MSTDADYHWVEDAIRNNETSLSEHVLREILEGRVTLSSIISVLSSKRVIEVHSHPKRNPFFVALGFEGDQPLHVMFCGSEELGLSVLIVYEPALPMWINPRTRSKFHEEQMKSFNGNCPFCTGIIKPVVVGNFDYRLEGRLYVVKSVPAGLCEQCGEKYISLETARKLEKLVTATQPEAVETVKVLSYPAD
jgi:YgiT-type zinc finger domain-containing protein